VENTSFPKYIEDKYGTRYIVEMFWEDEDGFDIGLIFDGEIVGRAQTAFTSPESMSLGDIKIFDHIIHGQQGCWYSILHDVFRRPYKTTNYQQRGLGSQLLQIVIDIARRKRIKRITGLRPGQRVSLYPSQMTRVIYPFPSASYV